MTKAILIFLILFSCLAIKGQDGKIISEAEAKEHVSALLKDYHILMSKIEGLKKGQEDKAGKLAFKFFKTYVPKDTLEYIVNEKNAWDKKKYGESSKTLDLYDLMPCGIDGKLDSVKIVGKIALVRIDQTGNSKSKYYTFISVYKEKNKYHIIPGELIDGFLFNLSHPIAWYYGKLWPGKK